MTGRAGITYVQQHTNKLTRKNHSRANIAVIDRRLYQTVIHKHRATIFKARPIPVRCSPKLTDSAGQMVGFPEPAAILHRVAAASPGDGLSHGEKLFSDVYATHFTLQ